MILGGDWRQTNSHPLAYIAGGQVALFTVPFQLPIQIITAEFRLLTSFHLSVKDNLIIFF